MKQYNLVLTAHREWRLSGGARGTRADLRGADLAGANLRGAIPAVPDIDAAILAAIGDEPARLDMSAWHKCGTTHCRAGWAITLAGEQGAALEANVGPAAAGALISAVSRPTMRVPNFYTHSDAVMQSLRDDAEAARRDG